MSIIGSLSVKLGLVTQDWDKATASVKYKAGELKKSFGEIKEGVEKLNKVTELVGVSLGAMELVKFAKEVFEYAHEIEDLSKAYDLSIPRILQFRVALEQSGGSADNAAKMLSSLDSKIEEAKQGSTSAIGQFERLGISFDDLYKKSPEQLFTKTVKGIAELDSAVARIANQKAVFGKGAIGIDIRELNESLEQTPDKFDKSSEAIERAAIAVKEIKGLFEELKITTLELGGKLFDIYNNPAYTVLLRNLPVILAGKAVLQALRGSTKEEFHPSTGGTMGLMGMHNTQIMGGIDYKAEAEAVKLFGKEQEKIRDIGGTLQSPAVLAALAKLDAAKQMVVFAKQEAQIKLDALTTDKTVIALRQVDLDYAKQLNTLNEQYSQEKQKLIKEGAESETITLLEKTHNEDLLRLEAERTGKKKLINAENAKEITITAEKLKLLKQTNEYEIDAAYLANIKYGMTANEISQAELLLNHKKKIAELEGQQVLARMELTGQAQKDQLETLQAQIDLENQLYTINQQGLTAEEERQQSFTFGWKQAFEQYSEQAKNSAQYGTEMFNTFTDDITNGILEFARTGKLAFKDFAASVIQDLLRIAIRMQMMKLIGGLFSGGASSSVSLNTEGMSGTIDLSNLAIPGHAAGGYVDRPSIVGESGKELFIPNRPGTIIPNARMGDFMNQQPSMVINGNYIQNMSAIDTQSATQFLAKNKQAVFAANQSAQRGLPAGR